MPVSQPSGVTLSVCRNLRATGFFARRIPSTASHGGERCRERAFSPPASASASRASTETMECTRMSAEVVDEVRTFFEDGWIEGALPGEERQGGNRLLLPGLSGTRRSLFRLEGLSVAAGSQFSERGHLPGGPGSGQSADYARCQKQEQVRSRRRIWRLAAPRVCHAQGIARGRRRRSTARRG